MATPFKHAIRRETLAPVADRLAAARPGFPTGAFLDAACAPLDDRPCTLGIFLLVGPTLSFLRHDRVRLTFFVFAALTILTRRVLEIFDFVVFFRPAPIANR